MSWQVGKILHEQHLDVRVLFLELVPCRAFASTPPGSVDAL